jgi:hypothetical protein
MSNSVKSISNRVRLMAFDDVLAALRKLATEAHAVLLCDPNLNAAIAEAEAVIAKVETETFVVKADRP